MRLAKPEETGKLSNMTLKETLNACLNKKPHEEGYYYIAMWMNLMTDISALRPT